MKNYLKNVKPLTRSHITIPRKKINIDRKLITERPEQILVSRKSTLTSISRRQKRNFEYEKVLDLHGNTREEAFLALIRFFSSCQCNGIRKVLIITGGNNMRETVLRKHFQIWVREKFGNHITSCTSANIWHGGEGAFYVTLKKV